MPPGLDGSDTESGALTLEEFVADAFGDFSDSASETPPAEAGAPPVPPANADATAATPEGTEAAARAGTPPDAAATPAPDAGAPAPIDPLAGATPLTYTVNGQARIFEGIKVLGEHGAIIEPAALPDVIRRLTERDHLFESGQQAYKDQQTLDRLSAWKVPGPMDAAGRPTFTDVKGRDGVVAMRSDYIALAAERDALITALDVPDLRNVLAAGADGAVTFSPAFLDTVRLHLDNARLTARNMARESIGELSKPVAPAPVAMSAAEVEAHAPAVIDQSLKGAGLDAALLTAADRQTLAKQMGRYLTMENGRQVVDLQFAELVKQMAGLRKENASTAATLSSTAAANAAKLAAVARGLPGTRPVTPAPKPVSQADERASKSDQAWALQQRLAAGRMAPG